MEAQAVNRMTIVPIADQIAEFIRNRVRFGTYDAGERLPGEWVLAEEFEVSRGTVRSALAQLEKERLITRKRGKGTFVAPSDLEARHGLTVIPFVVWDDCGFFPDVIRGASEEARSRGYEVCVSFTGVEGQHEGEAISAIVQRGMPGALISTHPARPADYSALREAGVRIVQVDQRREMDADYVLVDNFGGAKLAVEHLYGLGHRSIIHITHENPGDVPTRSDRIRGFEEACRQLGLDEDACPVASLEISAWEKEREEKRFREWVGANLFDDRPYTACVCYNDGLAAHLLRTAQALGRKVPDEMSVVGFDDSPVARTAVVPITSVGWDLVWMGKCAGRMLIDRIERPNEAPFRGTVAGARLAVRRSTVSALEKTQVMELVRDGANA